MYIRNDESNTIGFDKTDVDNKETIIDNYYQKSIMKTQGWKIDYENDITKNQLQKWHSPKWLLKSDYQKVIMKELLSGKGVTTKTGEMVTIICIDYPKMVGIISNR